MHAAVRMSRTRVGLWAATLSSVICVIALLPLIEPTRVWHILRAADPRFVTLMGLLIVLTYPIRSYRWGVLVRAVAPAHPLHLLSGTSVGLMANMLLPARVGDLVRGFLIARRTGLGVASGITTVAVERVLDVAVNLVVFGMLWSTTGLGRVWTGPETLPLALLAGVGAAVVLLLVWLQGRRGLGSLPDRSEGWLPFVRVGQLRILALETIRGLQGLARWQVAARAVVVSFALWAVFGLLNYVGLLALGVQLPLRAAYVTMLAQTVGVAVPSAPGYIGTFHLATVGALALYDIDAEVALSLALLLHASSLISSVIIGLPFLWYESLSLRQLRRVGDTSVVPIPAV